MRLSELQNINLHNEGTVKQLALYIEGEIKALYEANAKVGTIKATHVVGTIAEIVWTKLDELIGHVPKEEIKFIEGSLLCKFSVYTDFGRLNIEISDIFHSQIMLIQNWQDSPVSYHSRFYLLKD